MHRRLKTAPAVLLASCPLAFVAPAAAQKVVAPGVDSVRVRANIQAQFNTTSANDEPGSEWQLRRARVGVAGYAAGWLHAYVEGDFGAGDARLTDGYVTLEFDPRLEIRAGQFKVPFDEHELISSRELLVIERDPLPRGAMGFSPTGLLDGLGYNGRDIGIDWNGRFDRLHAAVGFFNGQGDNEEEADDGKQVAARIAGEIAEGWRVSGAWTGLRLSEPPVEDDAAWYHALELAVRAGEYAEPGLQLLGQLFYGDDYAPDLLGDEDASFIAWQGIVGYHIPTYETPYLIGWEPVVRLGWARIEGGQVVDGGDAVLSLDDQEPSTTVLTAGINLYWQERIRTQIQADLSSFDGNDALPDSNDVALRIQLGFGF
ncbi:MAG: porin [Gemmatimonadota bacterium]